MDVNCLTTGQETPLMKAAQFCQKNCIDLLIEWDADITAVNLLG